MGATDEMESSPSGEQILPFHQGVGLEDNPVKQFISRAVCYMRQEQWDSAHKNIREALKLDPDNIMALIYRGCVFLHWESEKKALAVFLRGEDR